MKSADGKFYLTDVADTGQLLRLIQSIPSPKAEPFKQWLAKVGYERLEGTQDPEKSLDRARNFLVNLSTKPLTFTPKTHPYDHHDCRRV